MFGRKIYFPTDKTLELNQTALDELLQKEIKISHPEPNQSATRWHARYKTGKLFLAVYPILEHMKNSDRYTSKNLYIKEIAQS